MKQSHLKLAAVLLAVICLPWAIAGCDDDDRSSGADAASNAETAASASGSSGESKTSSEAPLSEEVKEDLVGRWLVPGSYANDLLLFNEDGTGQNVLETGERTEFRYRSEKRGEVIITDAQGKQPDTYLYLTHNGELLLGLDPLKADWIRARKSSLISAGAGEPAPIQLDPQLFGSTGSAAATNLNEFMQKSDDQPEWNDAEQRSLLQGVWLLVREWRTPADDREHYDAVLAVREDGAARMVIQARQQRVIGELRLEKDPNAPVLRLVDPQQPRDGMYLITNGRLAYFFVEPSYGESRGGSLAVKVDLPPDEAVERFLSRAAQGPAAGAR